MGQFSTVDFTSLGALHLKLYYYELGLKYGLPWHPSPKRPPKIYRW